MKRMPSLLSVVLLLYVAVPAVADTLLYSNGAIDGRLNAWKISDGFEVSDSFTLYSRAHVETMSLGIWVLPGETPATLQFGFSASPFGYQLGFGAGTLSNVFQFTNDLGLDVYLSSFTFSSVDLAAGTYYVTLFNGSATNGHALYWDQNYGDSNAYENTQGPIPSESFSLGTASTPEPGTLIMLGTGLLTGVGVLRRKLSF